MTIREQIARRRRKTMSIGYSGFALFALGMLLGRGGPPVLSVALPGFAIFMGSIIYMFFFVHCPRCRFSIGYTISQASGPFSVSQKIRFCPSCGVALDSELDEQR